VVQPNQCPDINPCDKTLAQQAARPPITFFK